MKAIKTILVIIVIIALLGGMYFLGNNGLKYSENGAYSKNAIEEVARPYIEKVAISMIVILVYFMIRYNKLGIFKVVAIALIATLATQIIILAIMAIAKIVVNKILFSVMLLAFVLTILALTVKYEKDLAKV